MALVPRIRMRGAQKSKGVESTRNARAYQGDAAETKRAVDGGLPVHRIAILGAPRRVSKSNFIFSVSGERAPQRGLLPEAGLILWRLVPDR
jgi:hypothetical protein